MEFRGELSRDAVWSGRVRLTGDVVVPEGRTLRLSDGCALSFAPKPEWSCSVFRAAPQGYPIEATRRELCDIVVLGRLEAAGASLVGGEGAWGGITLLEAATAQLRGCSVGGAAEHAVQAFDDSVLKLSGGEIFGARMGILGWGLSRVYARQTHFHDCGSAVLCREGAFARLEACRLSRLSEGAWAQQWSLIEAERCSFEECSNFRAGAYERSRVTVDGAVVEGASSLR